MHEQMSRSGSQSAVKPPVLSSQESLALISRPTDGMKGRVDFSQPEVLNSPRAIEFWAFHSRSATLNPHCPIHWKHLRYHLLPSVELSRVPVSLN
ncbi:hypothetical protein TNCV_4548331 [Trichonephila clavipes]|nr:hypothetical protein TNCV_4548331 [Trichonephila clavipes]